jgi:L,D-transpeptidase catalytic domain
MSVSRRNVIKAGAAGAGALMIMPSLLRAQSIDPVLRGRPDRLGDTLPPRPYASAPATPRAYADPVIDPRLVTRARLAFDRHRNSVRSIETVGIVDYGKASNVARFYILDTNTGRTTCHYVAHGRGSDPEHTGFLQRFSNVPGSEASSAGGYVTSEYYPGRYGRAMRVRGLDYTNSNAESRAIVVHSAWYAEPQVAQVQGRLGRSEGCFALSYQSLQEVLARLGPGHFLYADRLA